MSGTIDRNQPISVTMTLPVGHWEAVLRVLDNAPHNIVRSLIDQIQQQCMRHAMPMGVPGGTNGAEAHPATEEAP
jgi:hypothetical protein